MQVIQAFRFELDPSREAQIALEKHVGAARFAYNWGLARCLEAKERGKQMPSAVDLHKDWNKWKRENAPWWVNAPLRRHSGIWSGPFATGGRAGPTYPASSARRRWRTTRRG